MGGLIMQEEWTLEQFQDHYRLNQSRGRVSPKPKTSKGDGRVAAAIRPVLIEAGDDCLTMRLPVPPSANRYWRHGPHGPYRSEEADAYIALLRQFAQDNHLQPLAGEVIYIAEYSIRKSRDLGNNGKVLQDALQGVAYVNDGQICEIHEYRKPFANGGSVIVTVALQERKTT